MTSTTKAPFIPKKPSSPFNADPHNNRGGKGKDNVKSNTFAGLNSKKVKSISVPKFKGGGSGGDR